MAQAASPGETPSSDPSNAAAAAKGAANAPTADELASQLQALQLKMDKLNPALAFVVDQDSGRALLQLTDRVTKEDTAVPHRGGAADLQGLGTV